VRFPGFDAYDVEPSHLPDVFAQRPVVIMGKWRGDAKGEIVIKGYAGKKSREIRVSVNNAPPDKRNAALKYIWARERIKMLSDYNGFGQDDKRDQAVTELGLQYNLLTAFTSFIAIDEVVASNGQFTSVKQPLPLPQGVSDLAVGFDLGINGISGLNPGVGSGRFTEIMISGVLILLLLAFTFRKRIRPFVLFGVAAATFGIGGCAQPEQVVYCEENSVAIILGEDHSSKNPYFASAAAYFRADTNAPIQVTTCANLQSAYHFLQTHRPLAGSWRQIRLVVHSNEWTGLRTPIDRNSPDRTNAAALETALQEGKFGPLPAGFCDANTCVVVDGCNIGQDTALLCVLSRCFGGAPVSAAPYVNIFEKQSGGTGIQHYLAGYRYVVFPQGSYPGNTSIVRQLDAKYPADTTDWSAALQRLQPRFAGDTYVHFFSIPANWITLYNDPNQRPAPITESEKLAWVRSQPELMQQLSAMRLRAEDFQWTLTPIEYAGNGVTAAAIQAEGLAKIYGVVQPLKESNGQLAQADFEDARYYNRGRSDR
jgi:hypothetical protein